MAERRRRGGAPPGLTAALARAARAERPVFSPALQERVCAAIVAGRRGGGARWPAPRPAWRGPAVGSLAAAVVGGLLLGVAWRWSIPQPAQPAAAIAATDGPGIERLPTPGEIGADLLAEMTSLVAAAAGVPSWNDFAAFAPGPAPAAADGRP